MTPIRCPEPRWSLFSSWRADQFLPRFLIAIIKHVSHSATILSLTLFDEHFLRDRGSPSWCVVCTICTKKTSPATPSAWTTCRTHYRAYAPPTQCADYGRSIPRMVAEVRYGSRLKRARMTALTQALYAGDVFSLHVPGKTIVVLGSEQAAVDLLEKRSAIYSNRARLGYYETYV